MYFFLFNHCFYNINKLAKNNNNLLRQKKESEIFLVKIQVIILFVINIFLLQCKQILPDKKIKNDKYFTVKENKLYFKKENLKIYF